MPRQPPYLSTGLIPNPRTMRITNLSSQPEGVLRSWLPHNLLAEQVVFLPDACPGKSPLPTGTVVLTRQTDWRTLALSDCGCGMRLLRSSLGVDDLTVAMWDEVAYRLRQNKGSLGDLGGGNHFLDALLPYDGETLYFLVHTGSRDESGLADGLVDDARAFDAEFQRVVAWAAANRERVEETIRSVVGPLELVLDHAHNTFEKTAEGVIIRKGSVRVRPGDLAVLPSHMSGDVALVKATKRVEDVLCSISHGTGRAMSRADAKHAAASFDFAALRASILLPSLLHDSSLTTEGPFAYRELDDCLALLQGYVEEEARFSVVAYAGHL